MSSTRSFTVFTGLAVLAMVTLSGCAADAGASREDTASTGTDRTIPAKKVMQLTKVHAETGMTLLEGPTFDEDGTLVVVDITAPEGEPKVLRVDVGEKTATEVYTDDRGAYTSAQFSPYDGRLYLTDFAHGDIVSLAPDGSDPRTFFSGDVDGAPMNPDDLAFDEEGNLYLSDSRA